MRPTADGWDECDLVAVSDFRGPIAELKVERGAHSTPVRQGWMPQPQSLVRIRQVGACGELQHLGFRPRLLAQPRKQANSDGNRYRHNSNVTYGRRACPETENTQVDLCLILPLVQPRLTCRPHYHPMTRPALLNSIPVLLTTPPTCR